MPVKFILFALVLAGVALFHRFTLQTALAGAAVIALYKTLFSPFRAGTGIAGFLLHLGHDDVIGFLPCWR